MNDAYAELRYWELIYHLVKREQMQIVHMNEDGPIIWLEDNRGKKTQLLRFHLKSYDWSRELRTDIERAYKASDRVRKKLNLRKANVVNVVTAPYTPVDSYESDVSRALPFTAGGQRQFRTVVLPLKELESVLFPLATEWKLQ
ncbi:hypothetical protein ALCH109712_04485 [Alkalicoccus chagannorensis]